MSAPVAAMRSANLAGMAWMTLSMLGFALCDMFIALAAREMPVGQILILFGLGGAPLLGVMAKMRGVRLLSPVIFSRPVMARNVAEMVATALVATSLAYIPLSLFSSVLQSVPLLVTLGAALFFAEPVGWRRWTAVLVGLAGVLVILRPWSAEFEPLALLAVAATAGIAARDLVTRIVPRDIPTIQVSTYGFASVVPAGLITLAISGGAAWPSAMGVLIVVAAILTGAVGYFSITAAMRSGDMSAVAPLRYTRIVFALFLAMIVLGERPDIWMYLGSAIVIATGLYTFARESRGR